MFLSFKLLASAHRNHKPLARPGRRSARLELASARLAHYPQAMPDETNNLVLEHLRAIRGDISEMKLKIDELAGSYAGLLKIAASQGDAIVRLDRRIERIEKRLDLVEA